MIDGVHKRARHPSRATFQLLADAGEEARRVDADQIGADHLLIAIVDGEPGAARSVLRSAGITSQTIRTLASASQPATGPARSVVYSPLTRVLLGMADREAMWRGDALIEPEHVLLALLMLGKQSQTPLLDDLHVDDQTMKTALERELQGDQQAG